MRILAVETHFKVPFKKNITRTSAVDWWRVINPFIHLKKNTDWEIEIRKGVLSRDDFVFGDENADYEWQEIGQNYDLVWFSYMENPLAYSYLQVLSAKYGLKFVIDLDDNLLRLSLNNPFAVEMMRNTGTYSALRKIIYDAPCITVTNSRLKKEYRDFKKGNGEIYVLPNAIDFEVYKADERTEDDVVTIGWFGGQNHVGDLLLTPFYEAIVYILKKYQGKVKFHIIGFMKSDFDKLPHFKRDKGDSDFYRWIKVWEEKTRYWDIGVCPIEESVFNEGKSYIKWMEMTALHIPVVASDFGPYKIIIDGKTGFRAKTTKNWIDCLEVLIKNPSLRKKLTSNAYEEIKKRYTIQKNWVKWKETIEKIVN